MVKSKGKKKVGRGKQWQEVELERMSKIILEVLPSGMFEWEKVANVYNNKRPSSCHYRNVDAITSKYKILKRRPSLAEIPSCLII